MIQIWDGPGTYEKRIADLSRSHIKANKFIDDAQASDQLCGQEDLDWFLIKLPDAAVDRQPGETITML